MESRNRIKINVERIRYPSLQGLHTMNIMNNAVYQTQNWTSVIEREEEAANAVLISVGDGRNLLVRGELQLRDI